MLTIIIIIQNLFSSGLPKYCILILGNRVSWGYFSLSLGPSAIIMIITALQSVRTKASERSEAWLRAQRRWSCVSDGSLFLETLSPCLLSLLMWVCPSLSWGCVCWGVALLHQGNLPYGIGESLYMTTGVSIFSVIIMTLGERLKKLDLEKLPQISKLQWTYSTFLGVLPLCLYFFTSVPSFEGSSSCLVAKSSGFSHPRSDWPLDFVEPTTWSSQDFLLSFIYLFIHSFIYLFIYLFLAVLGLRFCVRAFSSCGKRGPLFIAVRGPLTIVASLVAEQDRKSVV